MNVEFVANAEHRSVVDQLLKGPLNRVRIYALTVHDVQLIRTSLRLRLIRLLGSGCAVTIAFGESLWDPKTWQPKDIASGEIINFLLELQAHRANVWYVPNPRLHAKVLYVEESKDGNKQATHALVTSANFSMTALCGGNFELGCNFRDLDVYPDLRQRIKKFTDGVLGAGRSLADVVQTI